MKKGAGSGSFFCCEEQAGERWNGKRHAAFVFVHDIPFALLRAPIGLSISGRMCIHWMPGSAAGSLRAPSAGNVLNSQPAAIALSVPSLPARCEYTKKGAGSGSFLLFFRPAEGGTPEQGLQFIQDAGQEEHGEERADDGAAGQQEADFLDEVHPGDQDDADVR